jgi:hypothetical protein
MPVAGQHRSPGESSSDEPRKIARSCGPCCIPRFRPRPRRHAPPQRIAQGCQATGLHIFLWTVIFCTHCVVAAPPLPAAITSAATRPRTGLL